MPFAYGPVASNIAGGRRKSSGTKWWWKNNLVCWWIWASCYRLEYSSKAPGIPAFFIYFLCRDLFPVTGYPGMFFIVSICFVQLIQKLNCFLSQIPMESWHWALEGNQWTPTHISSLWSTLWSVVTQSRTRLVATAECIACSYWNPIPNACRRPVLEQ